MSPSIIYQLIAFEAGNSMLAWYFPGIPLVFPYLLTSILRLGLAAIDATMVANVLDNNHC